MTHILTTPIAQQFLDTSAPHFDALLQHLARVTKPFVLGINGCQGSGKSTLAAFLAQQLNAKNIATLSLSQDDFYLTRAERQQLAHRIHPLLATRGVPGTHDVSLAIAVLDKLARGEPTAVPHFDKHRDDRAPSDQWHQQTQPLAVIIIEGWCMGCPPQSAAELAQPVNELEAREDASGHWRQFVNDALANTYPHWFARVDEWVMLQAPNFGCVQRWRSEQERQLLAQWRASHEHTQVESPIGIMSAEQLARFIAHYQRLTEHMLRTLPARVDHLVTLNDQRDITAVRSSR